MTVGSNTSCTCTCTCPLTHTGICLGFRSGHLRTWRVTELPYVSRMWLTVPIDKHGHPQAATEPNNYMPPFWDTNDQIPSYSLNSWQSEISKPTRVASELHRPFLENHGGEVQSHMGAWVTQKCHPGKQSPEPTLAHRAVLAEILPC